MIEPTSPPLLIVAKLTVSSSYGENYEQQADESCDTVQLYWPADGSPSFRVRTFAIDHDIHVHELALPDEDPTELWQDHLHRIYAGVIGEVRVVQLHERATDDLVKAGLSTGHLESAETGFSFWNPDGAEYKTKTVPQGPFERRGLQEVVYLGGIARFWLPQAWQVEMSEEDGGCFFDPDSSGTLRLNVLTFASETATEPPVVRLPTDDREIEHGHLAGGHEFNVCEHDFVEDDVPMRMRRWQIAQVLPGQLRLFLFSYAYDLDAEEELADELAMLDGEIRLMVPHPVPV